MGYRGSGSGGGGDTIETIPGLQDALEGLNQATAALQQDVTGKASADHAHAEADQSNGGFMSAADKTRLDNLREVPDPSGQNPGMVLSVLSDGSVGWDYVRATS